MCVLQQDDIGLLSLLPSVCLAPTDTGIWVCRQVCLCHASCHISCACTCSAAFLPMAGPDLLLTAAACILAPGGALLQIKAQLHHSQLQLTVAQQVAAAHGNAAEQH